MRKNQVSMSLSLSVIERLIEILVKYWYVVIGKLLDLWKILTMKKLLLILLCLPMIGFGQILSPSVIGSAGASFSNSTSSTDLTVGEVMIETFSNITIISQGFHQGIEDINSDVINLDINTKVYPNPTTNFLIIELEQNVNAELLVYDINGKIVIKDKLNNEQQKQLDFSFLSQGNYLLHINIADNQSVYQINKSK